jgi:hypothetical protein
VSFFTQTGTPAACVSVRGNIGGETIYCDVTAAPLGWIKSRAVSWPSLRVMRSAADLASLAEIFEGDLDTLIVHLLEIVAVLLASPRAAGEEFDDMADRGS